MNPAFEKQLYQAAFAASLGYLFIALVIVGGPTYPFGFFQTVLSIIACVLTWRALTAAKKRSEAGAKTEEAAAPGSLVERLSDLEEARKKGLVTEEEYQSKRTKRTRIIASP